MEVLTLLCPYCGSDNIAINGVDEYVCRNCGTVLGQRLAPPLVLNYTRTIGTFNDFTAIELYAVEGEVKRLANLLKLPERCIREAMYLTEYVIRGRKVTVRQPEALAAAVLFYGCRRTGVLLPLKPLMQYTSAERETVKRAVWELSRIMPLRYEETLLRAAKMFGVSPDAVLELWKRYKRKLMGKSPRVVAAALIYLANRSLNISDVSSRLGASEVSVRHALKAIKNSG